MVAASAGASEMNHLVRTGAIALTLLAAPAAAQENSGDYRPVQRLLDLSGLASLGGDRFLAVHDAKFPGEPDRVRASLLRLPESLDGIQWKPLRLRFPAEPSSDLESAARIPGTDHVLLIESGDDAGAFHRLFLGTVRGDTVEISDTADWSGFAEVFNVEASAVAQTGGGYLFVWAERSSGAQSTQIRWTTLGLDPLAFSPEVSGVEFALPGDLVDAAGKPLYTRPVVALDVGPDGAVYSVAAFDPEGAVKDPDNGPFRSAAFSIGRIDGDGLTLHEGPALLAAMDGLKAESIAILHADGQAALFIGTDDENYGGTLRRLPLAAPP